MGQFLGPDLDVRELDDDRWRLLVPVMFRSNLVGEIIVPAGFVTDFSSLPKWIPVAYVVFKGVGRRASILHDYGYARGLPVSGRPMDRATVDDLFLEGLTTLGVTPWKRRVLWWGVRLGGWVAWWWDGRQAR